ncbi:hypothetical protein BLA29_003948, partial [Euroglyphus maynei]
GSSSISVVSLIDRTSSATVIGTLFGLSSSIISVSDFLLSLDISESLVSRSLSFSARSTLEHSFDGIRGKLEALKRLIGKEFEFGFKCLAAISERKFGENKPGDVPGGNDGNGPLKPTGKNERGKFIWLFFKSFNISGVMSGFDPFGSIECRRICCCKT